MMTKKIFVIPALALLTVGAVACKGGEKPAEAPKAEAPAAAAPAAAVPTEKGSVQVTVKFTGQAPKMRPLPREADPFCGKTKMTAEDVIVNANGTLLNAVVQVNGVPGTYAPTQASIEVSQDNCMYRPRVSVAMTGQEAQIHNNDQTMHNVHAYVGSETVMNQGQPQGSPALPFKFENGAKIVKFTCDVHPWMTGYVVQNTTPFNGVTGQDGLAKIADVPVGTYKIQVWQEMFGTKEVEVTVKANETASVEVAYDGTEKAGG